MKRTIGLLAACSVCLLSTACGSGGGGGGATPSSSSGSSSTITGQILKGPFKKGSVVEAQQLNGTGSASTLVSADTGKYTLTVPWNGLTKISVTGFYTDEFTGQTSAESIRLAAIGSARSGTAVRIHVNLATTLVARLVELAIQASPVGALDVQQTTTLRDVGVAQLVSALLGATSTPGTNAVLPNLSNILSSIDLSATGSAAAQLLAFELVVHAAMPAGANLNQIIDQFAENIFKSRSFADPIAGKPGVTLADLWTAVGELKTGILTVKSLGKQVALQDIMDNLTLNAGVQSNASDLQTQANGSPITSLTISPNTTLLSPILAKSLGVSAKDIQGKSVGSFLNKPAILWSSSDPAIATADLSGKISGLVPGIVTITASNGSITKGTATITVISDAVVSIAVTPGSSTINLGAQQQFAAIAQDGVNNPLTGVNFTWASSDQAVATIDQTGLATATQQAGTTTITASSGGITSQGVTLTVSPAPPPVPTMSFFNPKGGLENTLVTVVGTGFSSNPGLNLVSFGPLATIKSATANKLLVSVPPAAQSGPVTVTSPGGTVSGGIFNTNVINPSLRLMSTLAGVGAGPEGIAISPGGNLLYVANAGANPNTLTVIEVSTQNTQAITIAPPQFFSSSFASVVANPNGQFVYVSLNDGYGVIDPANNFSLTKHTCCVAPAHLAVSPDGLRLYVADGANKLVLIDTTTHQVIKTYDSFPPGQIPFGVAAHPDGNRVYVTAPNSDTVFIIDTAQDTIGAIALPANSAPFNIAFSPDGLTAYASLFSSNGVAVIDTSTSTLTDVISLPAGHHKKPNGLAVSPDGKRVYVALTCEPFGTCPVSDTDLITSIDLTKSPPTSSDISNALLSFSAQAVVFSPNGAFAYFTAQKSTSDNRVIQVR